MSNMSRRQFLRGLGGFTLSIPFLQSIAPQELLAQSVSPKRFFAVCTYDGYFENVYYPQVEPSIKMAEDLYYMQLKDISGELSPMLKSRFDSFRNKMNIYRGLDIPGSFGHSWTNMLAGSRRVKLEGGGIAPTGTGASIDRILAQSKNFYSTTPMHKGLYGQEPSYNYSMSIERDENGNPVRIPYQKKPGYLFKQVFSSPIKDPTVRAEVNSKKTLIGDMVLADFKNMMNHRRISKEDKVRLESFVDEVHELNRRLASSSGSSCSEPELHKLPGYWSYMTEEQKVTLMKDHIDVIVAAAKCDLSRIGIISMRLLGHDHGLSHKSTREPNNYNLYIKKRQLIIEVVKHFVSRLDSEIDINGKSMLDNSILFWGSEQSEGQGHRTESMPAITFGSAGGKLNTGLYADYRQRPFFYIAGQKQYPAIGQSYSRLLITFMQALGLQPSDYLSYGDGGGFGYFNKDPSYSKERYHKYEADRNKPLPLFLKA